MDMTTGHDEREVFDPETVAHSFAMKYGLRAHLTYEQAMVLEADLTTHLRAWTQAEVSVCNASRSITQGGYRNADFCLNTVGHKGKHGPWRTETTPVPS